jgi:hypothetical protein
MSYWNSNRVYASGFHISDFRTLNERSTEPATQVPETLTQWFESASELYRPSDRRLSAKLVPTFAHKGCYVVSVADPYGHIFGFLDRESTLYLAEFPSMLWYQKVHYQDHNSSPLKLKFRSLSQRANYTGRATAACQRS